MPKAYAGWGFHYEKFHRTAQAWAIVGVAVPRPTARTARSPRPGSALTNMGSKPVRASAVEEARRRRRGDRDALPRRGRARRRGHQPAE